MPAFVVRFGAGRARRYLAQPDGRRPLVWVRDLARAEKFATAEKARTFALDALGHSLWDVAVAPPAGAPTDRPGGSPAALRRAA